MEDEYSGWVRTCRNMIKATVDDHPDAQIIEVYENGTFSLKSIRYADGTEVPFPEKPRTQWQKSNEQRTEAASE